MRGRRPRSAQGLQVTQIGTRDVVSQDTFIPTAPMLDVNSMTQCTERRHLWQEPPEPPTPLMSEDSRTEVHMFVWTFLLVLLAAVSSISH